MYVCIIDKIFSQTSKAWSHHPVYFKKYNIPIHKVIENIFNVMPNSEA